MCARPSNRRSQSAARGPQKRGGSYDACMRFVVTLFLGLVVLAAFQPWLNKLGIGRLPGDLNFKLGQRQISLPFASTLLLTLLVWLIGRLI